MNAYRRFIGSRGVERIRGRASSLRGLRVVHINATPDGGGVAEILRSLVPLQESVGLDARWYVLPPDPAFFAVTKQIHNCLQGQPGRLSLGGKRTYRGYLTRVAAEIRSLDADVWLVHDPQPLPLRTLAPLQGAAVWRCHIDCSTPNGGAREYLLPWVKRYDRAVFSMPEHVLDGLRPRSVRVMYPAIDPLATTNRAMRLPTARAIVARLGVDPARPLVTQVARFDPWKNPWQAVDAYQLARREVPGLQLALVGEFARDDPQGPRIYDDIRRYAGGDADIRILTDPEVGRREVNAFQLASAVVLQRSRREGFGLSVTEAMWKNRPVIAAPVGGITTQIVHAKNGFLAESADGCAEHIVRLLGEPRLANAIGRAARQTVRERFLLPRLLEDDLRLFEELASGGARDRAAA